MQTQEILERAREGDPRVIAAILNHTLKSWGVEARAARRDRTLHLVLEANPLPEVAHISPVVEQIIHELQITSLEEIILYGQLPGNEFVTWKQDLALTPGLAPGVGVARPPGEPSDLFPAAAFMAENLDAAPEPALEMFLEPMPESLPESTAAPTLESALDLFPEQASEPALESTLERMPEPPLEDNFELISESFLDLLPEYGSLGESDPLEPDQLFPDITVNERLEDTANTSPKPIAELILDDLVEPSSDLTLDDASTPEPTTELILDDLLLDPLLEDTAVFAADLTLGGLPEDTSDENLEDAFGFTLDQELENPSEENLEDAFLTLDQGSEDSDENLEDAFGLTLDQAPEDASDENSEILLDEMLGDQAEELSEPTSEMLLGEMLEQAFEETPELILGEMPEQAPEQTSELILGEMPEQAANAHPEWSLDEQPQDKLDLPEPTLDSSSAEPLEVIPLLTVEPVLESPREMLWENPEPMLEMMLESNPEPTLEASVESVEVTPVPMSTPPMAIAQPTPRDIVSDTDTDTAIGSTVDQDAESLEALLNTLQRPESVVLLFALVLATFWEIYLELAEGHNDEALSGANLAKRLNVSASTVSRRKFLDDFSRWSQSLDPDQIAWVYQGGRFWPLDGSIVTD